MLNGQFERPSDQEPSTVFEYLSVDDFLQEIITSRALKTGFELNLIDYLINKKNVSKQELQQAVKIDKAGFDILLRLLKQNNIIDSINNNISLTERFKHALDYRDLLEVKLDFCGFITADFHELFTLLLTDPTAFRQHARLFKLFDYHRCIESNIENYEWTKHWVKVTTALSRYESQVCMHFHDFSVHHRMLDIGGNSGEFVLQICRKFPSLQGTVLDLPVVCEVGMEHILPQEERERIKFIKADVRKEQIPGGYDLISFKSMLHDWPDDDVRTILSRAAQALEPGGTLLIFERASIVERDIPINFSTIPILLFFRSYRIPDVYISELQSLGLQDIQLQEVELDTPFLIISAKK